MIESIREQVRFWSHKLHVPIELVTEKWQIENWNRESVIVGVPVDKDIELDKILGGDLIVVNKMPVARIGKSFLVFCGVHESDLARKLIDQHLPRLARVYRKEQRDVLLTSITTCVGDRRRILQSSIREDTYELERLGQQMMTLARKIETDRHVLHIFEKPEEWIRMRANRSYVDLMKLVPGVYRSFRFADDSVVGTTDVITIMHDGQEYDFQPYEVEVDMRNGKVFISGGEAVNGYIHPHVTDDSSNICWGNIGPMVSRMAGELDLFPLFQLVHQFLITYNFEDPYQRIEKWDPDWVEEEDEESYCSFCDEPGHDVTECEYCYWCEECADWMDHPTEECPNRKESENEAA